MWHQSLFDRMSFVVRSKVGAAEEGLTNIMPLKTKNGLFDPHCGLDPSASFHYPLFFQQNSIGNQIALP